VRWPRQNALWITLGVLSVLLVLLAALQNRWLSDLGRAEAETRQIRIERAASRFQRAFDREMGEALYAFRSDPGDTRDPRPQLAQQLVDLHRRDPDTVVSAVLLLTRGAEGAVVERCDPGGAFHRVPWVPALDPVRERLLAGETRPEEFKPSIVGDPPGLVFPVFRTRAPAPARAPSPAPSPSPAAASFSPWGSFTTIGYLIVQLDIEKLRTHLIPTLAEAHFGPLRESEFVVAVTRRDDLSVVYSSDTAMPASDLAHSDAHRTLPGFDARGGGGREGREAQGRPAPGAARTAADAQRPESAAPWLLLVRHRGGSLEEAVAHVRRRNVAIGLGVLALLGTAGAVLAVSAQRAHDLARQQVEFVAGVTHELNTPLAALRSAGQNLADGIVTEPASVQRYGQLIEREGARLAALVAQALDFAGIASGSRAYAAEPVALAPLVDDALGDLRLVLEQGGFTIEKELPADLPPVRGDAAALRRVVANLVANAAKFASAGRWIGIRAAPAGTGRRILLRVEDRGPGIARDERERVFEPFYRGRARERNEAPGAGLGLSLVRHVVRAHGGEARVEAAAGGGAAVVLELPAAEEPGRP
jgi:signal transduction histidine kinase